MTNSPIIVPRLGHDCRCRLLFCLCLWSTVLAYGRSSRTPQTCPTVRMEVRRLPDLNIPRTAHSIFCTATGEVVVAGGHKDGFVPTPTAEYFDGKRWKLMETTYIHDFGQALPLCSGRVLLMGGCEKALGIGRSFAIEEYDPVAHTFRGIGCMAKERAMCSALELDSGRVLIAGNWYNFDSLEVFDGQHASHFVPQVSQQRSSPYVLRTEGNNAMIFSSRDIRFQPFDSIVADQLQGPPFCPSLFRTWRPCNPEAEVDHGCLIEETPDGLCSYLFCVERADGQMAIARTRGTDIALLPTAVPVPMQTPQGRSIHYFTNPKADRSRGRAYVAGVDDEWRLCILAVDYLRASPDQPAPIRLYYTDPLPDCGFFSSIALTPEGDILLAGGRHADNYKTYGTALLLRMNEDSSAGRATGQWLWWLLLGMGLTGVAVVWLWRKRRSRGRNVGQEAENGQFIEDSASSDDNRELMARIRQLMEEEQCYLNPDLKMPDVADRLGVHRNTVSNAINSSEGCSFSTYVNTYRVEHAKRLLQQQIDKKLSAVALESGFANEQSFFRAFKSVTGTTPREWLQQFEA